LGLVREKNIFITSSNITTSITITFTQLSPRIEIVENESILLTQKLFRFPAPEASTDLILVSFITHTTIRCTETKSVKRSFYYSNKVTSIMHILNLTCEDINEINKQLLTSIISSSSSVLSFSAGAAAQDVDASSAKFQSSSA